MKKLSLVSAAFVLIAVSTLVSAASPPGAPDAYSLGPMPPRSAATNLSAQERAAFALLEGIMQSVEAKVHSTGCAPVGIPVVLPLEVYSDAFTAPVTGDATVGIPPDSLTLFAKAQTTPGFRGQAIDVAQDDGDPTTVDTGYVNGTEITGYAGTHTFNSANNMMVGWMEVNAMSINWEPNQFIGYVIKDFYMGQDAIGNSQAIPPVLPDTHIVYDWGLQFLSKAGYPVEKYWQRSKVRRSDGGQGYTAFVKDRLVGVTKCRIAVVLQGFNEVGLFWQSGTLTISAAAPGDAVPEFTAIPNI